MHAKLTEKKCFLPDMRFFLLFCFKHKVTHDIIVMHKNVPMKLKRKALNECKLPVMTYGCKTWSISYTQLEELVTTQRKMERIILLIILKDRKSINWIW